MSYVLLQTFPSQQLICYKKWLM